MDEVAIDGRAVDLERSARSAIDELDVVSPVDEDDAHRQAQEDLLRLLCDRRTAVTSAALAVGRLVRGARR